MDLYIVIVGSFCIGKWWMWHEYTKYK